MKLYFTNNYIFRFINKEIIRKKKENKGRKIWIKLKIKGHIIISKGEGGDKNQIIQAGFL
jgi:hypothetical protein